MDILALETDSMAKFSLSTKQTKQLMTQSGDFNLNGVDINMAYATHKKATLPQYTIIFRINIPSESSLFIGLVSRVVSGFHVYSVGCHSWFRMKTSTNV